MTERTEVPAESPALADGERGAIQSIERAAAVLSLLDQDTRTLTAVIVAERLGLNRTTAHRYLLSLQKSGFLGPGYGPGPLLDQLTALSSPRQRILDFAPSILRQLADQTGLTSVLSVLGRTGVVVTRVEEATAGTVVLTIPVGTVLELRAAQTRVLLAFQSDPSVVRRLHAPLDADEARLESDCLARVRRDRLAWADLGRAGIASVAVPVFGSRDVQAAMGLLGTAAMLESDAAESMPVARLREAAEKLSTLIVN
jgi:DNA-binding IclR family transcriptional regulator